MFLLRCYAVEIGR